MTTPRVASDQINVDAAKAAAEEYVARQELRSHPKMEEDHRGRFVMDASEKRDCCTPYLKRRYELNQHARSAEHVANLFDVDIQDMMQHVTRLRGE
jgi:hypothetical protein